MTAQIDAANLAIARARWRAGEAVFWILVVACALVFPSRYLIMTDIVRLALFAMSLDLILGYAGIVSLGHAAFFGVGAYCAGLLSLHGIINEPVIALLVAGLAAGVLGYALSHIVVRFRHLALIMLTMGFGLLLHEAFNSASDITGGADGLQGFRVPGVLDFKFDMFGRTAYA